MTLRFLSSFLVAAGIFAAGCESGLQERLDEKRDARFTKAAEAVAAVETQRNTALQASVPTAAPGEGAKEHPLDGWRRQVIAREDQKTLKTLAANAQPPEGFEPAVGALGTPALYAADIGAQFLKESNDFWDKEQSSSLTRYADFLRNYHRNIEAKRGEVGDGFVEPPFQDEAAFDRAFIHALNYLNLALSGERSGLYASNANDYQVAFGVAMRSTSEGFSDYISRLCALNDGLKERCAGVPHEFRPAVVDRAFLEWLKSEASSFSPKTASGEVFKDVLKPLITSLEEATKDPIVAVEDPILPPTVAPVGGINGVRVVLSPNSGLKVHNMTLAESFDGSLPGNLDREMGKTFDTIRATPGGGVDYQRAALELPTDLPARHWVAMIRSFPNSLVKELFFVARRRADGSMRRTAVTMKLPRPDDSATASYAFKEDSARTSCALVGTLGDAPFGKKRDIYLEVTPQGVRVAELAEAEEGQERVMGETQRFGPLEAALADPEAGLAKFFADNPGIRLRAFVRGFDYGQGLDAVSRILYSCRDERMSYDDPTREPFMRPCGRPEQRAMAMVLSVCE